MKQDKMNSFEEFDCNYIFVVGNYNRIVQLWGGESVQDEINKTVHLVAIKFFKPQKIFERILRDAGHGIS